MSSGPGEIDSGRSGGVAPSGGSAAIPANDGESFLSKLKENLPYSKIITFFKNPAGFTLGFVLTAILTMFERATELVIELVLLVFGGAEPFASPPGETPIGIADVAVFIVRALLTPFGAVGDELIGLAAELGEIVEGVAANAGPLAPVASTALWAVIAFATLWVGRTALLVVLQTVPGGSAVLTLTSRIGSLPGRLGSALRGD